MPLRVVLCVLFCACAGNDGTTEKEPVVPSPDAGVVDAEIAPIPRVDAAPPPVIDAAPRPTPDGAIPPPPPPPVVDAAPPPPRVDAAPPPPGPWSNTQKCENMCQSYCVHLYNCDGSSIEECRMAIDMADGGTCDQRANLFADIPQAQVEACIADIDAMSCPDFLHMYNTGEGVPSSCHGILN